MAISSQGTIIEVETTPGGGTFTAVGEVSGYTAAGSGKAELDVTNLSSVAKEYIAGLPDYGTYDIAMFFTDPEDAGQAILRANYQGQAADSLLFQATSGTRVIQFNAYVSNWTRNGAVDTPTTQDASLRMTGPEVEA
jgi:hypothetical protein